MRLPTRSSRRSSRARLRAGHPATRRPTCDRYQMLAHGSHLVDIARFLAGEIETVHARLRERFGARCWFVDVGFAVAPSATSTSPSPSAWIGTRALRFTASMAASSARPSTPGIIKSSEVDIFRERDATWYASLAADGHFYRRQVEGFADAF